MLFKFFISLITNETKHRFVFTGHFHVSFSKMLSYPLPIFYFFLPLLVIEVIYTLWLICWHICGNTFMEKF